jgi:hypothetical protein
VPAYDLLNHVNGCGTYAATEPCGAPAGEQCVAIRTRVAVPRGAEACNTYGWLAPDHALLHYGFLPTRADGGGGGGRLPELSRVDRRGFKRTDLATTEHAPHPSFNGAAASRALVHRGPFRGVSIASRHPNDHVITLPSPPRTGSPAEMQAERQRLAALVDQLQELEPLAAVQQPDASEDPDGGKLSLLLTWRRQRVAALKAEVARLDAAATLLAADQEQGQEQERGRERDREQERAGPSPEARAASDWQGVQGDGPPPAGAGVHNIQAPVHEIRGWEEL